MFCYNTLFAKHEISVMLHLLRFIIIKHWMWQIHCHLIKVFAEVDTYTDNDLCFKGKSWDPQILPSFVNTTK